MCFVKGRSITIHHLYRHVIHRSFYHRKSSTSKIVSPEEQRAALRYFIFVVCVVFYYGARSNDEILYSGAWLFQVLQVVVQGNPKDMERRELNGVSEINGIC